MTTYHGNDGEVDFGGNTVGELQRWSIDIQQELTDDSAAGDAWRSHVNYIKSWSATVEVWYDPDDTGQAAADDVGTDVAIKLYGQGGSTSGLEEFSGTATVERVSVSNDKGGIVSRTFQLKGKGALAIADVSP